MKTGLKVILSLLIEKTLDRIWPLLILVCPFLIQSWPDLLHLACPDLIQVLQLIQPYLEG